MMGGSKKKLSVEDIYPQLSRRNTRGGNNAVDWDNISEEMKQQFIAAGLFTPEGEPTRVHTRSI